MFADVIERNSENRKNKQSCWNKYKIFSSKSLAHIKEDTLLIRFVNVVFATISNFGTYKFNFAPAATHAHAAGPGPGTPRPRGTSPAPALPAGSAVLPGPAVAPGRPGGQRLS